MTNPVKKPETKSKEQVKKTDKKCRHAFLSSCLLIVLLILAGISYVGWTQLDELKKNASSQTRRDDVKLAREIDQLKTRINAQEKTLLTLQSNAEHRKTAVDEQTNRYKKEEIIFLIQMAQQHLALEKNVRKAIIYLNEAKKLSGNLNEKKWKELNQKIEEKIIALTNSNLPNPTAIIANLIDLGEKINQLTVKKIQTESKPVTEKAVEKTNLWEKGKQQIVDLFKKAIIIKKQSDENGSVIIPQRNYILASVRTLFLEAQWSILENQFVNYENNLDKLSNAVESYFEKNSLSEKLLFKLNELKKINITEDIPNLSDLLRNAESLLLKNETARKQAPVQKDMTHEVLPS